MENQCQNLTMTKPNELIQSLRNFKELFNGTLGTWKIDPVEFELEEDANRIYSRPYPVTNLHKYLKIEVERLVIPGVLEMINDSEWGAPFFFQHKPKSN